MAEKTTEEFRFTLLGSRGAGKTTLISCILREARRMLPTGVSLSPDDPTQARIARCENDLNGSIDAREFRPGAMAPGMDVVEYRMSLNVDDHRLKFAVLDYPGGWLNPEFRPVGADWNRVEAWMLESSAIVIPIDAAALMSAEGQKGHAGAYTKLEIATVNELTTKWAAARAAKKLPSLLLLAPLRCESYFDDNGGKTDRSDELFRNFNQKYRQVMDDVKHQFRNDPALLHLEYHPIDTIGCVELESYEWRLRDGAVHTHEFWPVFKAREPYARSTVGGEGILNAMCRVLLTEAAKEPEGFFEWMWDRVSFAFLRRGRLHEVMKTLAARSQWPRMREV